MSVAQAKNADPFTVAVAVGADALDALDARWDDLLDRQPLPNPLLSATWLRALARWRTGVPLVVTAESGGVLIASAALELRSRLGRLGPLMATWLGPFEQLFCPDVLADPERSDAARAVLDAALAHADFLRLERTPGGGAAATAMAEAAPWHRSHQTGIRWTAPLPLPRRDHLHRRFASEVAKAERAGASVAVRVARDPDELTAALVRMFHVHRDRWRDRPDEEPRFATTRAHRSWNAGVIAEMAATGRVRLAEVVEDGRTVGADIWLLHGRGAVAHTTAMRPARALEHPGHLAAFACLEAVTEAGARAVDFGAGVGGPGTTNHRFGAAGEPVVVLVAARSPARQRQLEAIARLRGVAARIR